jgi:hypothetical protein
VPKIGALIPRAFIHFGPLIAQKGIFSLFNLSKRVFARLSTDKSAMNLPKKGKKFHTAAPQARRILCVLGLPQLPPASITARNKYGIDFFSANARFSLRNGTQVDTNAHRDKAASTDVGKAYTATNEILCPKLAAYSRC